MFEYQIQVLTTDFQYEEFYVEAESKEEALAKCNHGIHPSKVSMIAVFEGESNISCDWVVLQHEENAMEVTKEWPEWYGEWHEENQSVINGLILLDEWEAQEAMFRAKSIAAEDDYNFEYAEFYSDMASEAYGECAEIWNGLLPEVQMVCPRLLDYIRV